jgi:Domain of unknown function (DUF5063)
MALQPSFVAAAEAFIAVVESSDTRSQIEFVRELERVLVDLYAAGLTLEDVKQPDSEWPDALHQVSHDELAPVMGRLMETFGDLGHYRVFYDPYDADEDARHGWGLLPDDVTDIYSDLLDGFVALRKGETTTAFWLWKWGFDGHWGHHAAGAIYALYNLRDRLG